MVEILLWALIIALCAYLFLNQIHIHHKIMFTNDRIAVLFEKIKENSKKTEELNGILIEIKEKIK